MQKNTPVIIGRFGAPYGVHGWIKVHSFTDPIDNIKNYPHWLTKNKNTWVSVAIEAKKNHSHGFLAKIKGIDSPEMAQHYTNQWIGIEPSDLPALPEGEYYWSQLIGLTVITLTGHTLGKIAYLFATGANDVIVIKDENNHEHLIPYVAHVVKSVNLTTALMQVDWEDDS